MAYVALFVLAAGLGTYGYWRGGARVGLALAPILLASILFWLLGGLVYRLDFLYSAGFVWPGLVLLMLGLGSGYFLQHFARKKLPKEPPMPDRIAGAAAGALLAVVAVWLGSFFVAVLSMQQHPGQHSDSADAARLLNKGVVRWIPGIGAASSDLTSVMDIAAANQEVRDRAAEKLQIDHLWDSPAMSALANDPATMEDMEAAARMNLGAIWRLQKNPLVIELVESPEMQDILDRVSLEDIAAAVREAERELHGGAAETDEPDG